MRAAPVPQSLRLLTLNLRFDSQPDSLSPRDSISSLPRHLPTSPEYYKLPYEAPWSTRRLLIAREIAFTSPDLILVQEALHRQVLDLCEILGPTYSGPLGVGRDDGVSLGEYAAIFYKPSKLKHKESETFWLSEEPFKVGSKFPGAGSVRIATAATFNDGALVVVNTHWDEQSDDQRKLAGSLLRWYTGSRLNSGASTVIVAGDFNSPSEGPDSAGYQIITGQSLPVEISDDFKKKYKKGENAPELRDLAQECDPMGRSGHLATFTGFRGFERRKQDMQRIDFVMMAGNGEVERYRVAENWWDADRVLSDHRPVYVDVKIQETDGKGACEIV
ncbi:hypothetical protein EX30DRAFT_343516 [Ascodesmis nigricans]|uniref:Endonuclease/exonuclease/phosphatase domain-containing protein n=1 Tax=Ascodesmis nigricans TaxID=341454 RepID=A0A4S2MM50_9PEZI|nr:hypothetical protein EX30DRAFT_343516 [Ascodesmis nigricans]